MRSSSAPGILLRIAAAHARSLDAMLAAVCHDFGQPLVFEEVELASPGPGEVKLHIAACAICQSDVHSIDGAWGGELPCIFGHEAAGTVEAVGTGVEHVRPGDRVVVSLVRSCGACYFCRRGERPSCNAAFPLSEHSPLHLASEGAIRQGLAVGGFAERALVHASQVVAIPDDLSFDRAALLGCGVVTGFCAVTRIAALAPGDDVVVMGAGGVGLNIVQAARLSGAASIVVADLDRAKLAAATRLGATHTANLLEHEDVDGIVGALTDRRGADCVFVAAGSPVAFERGLQLLRRGGMLVVVGMPAYGVTVDIEPVRIAEGSYRIVGSKMGGTDLAVDIPQLIQLHRDGQVDLDALIADRYTFEEINEALASAREGVVGRNVIEFP